jgi:site-specific recombinase XerC
MPKPYRLFSTRPLPAGAEIVQHEGKPHVRIRDERGRAILCPLTKDGTKMLKPSKRWYFDIPGQGRVKGFTDLKSTEQHAAEMERKAERRKYGYADPAEEHIRRPLADHLKDYAGQLEAKGGTAEHVRLTTGRVSALLAGCGFVLPLDADAGRAAEWLNSIRRDGAAAELPDGESFTPAEAAKLLGISGSAVRAAVKRMNLAATGNGKARTLPRATVEALVLKRAKGCGPETINHYIRAVRGFFRWLVKSNRLGSNPLDSLELVNAAVDVRRTRRELNADELRRLFIAARGSTRVYRGLTGEDRYMLYLVAAGTGFRANALAHLMPADFDLTAATVTLAARLNKSRRLKVQPLPADVADALRGYLTGKPEAAPVWGGTWARDHRGAEMLRIDLEAAGIAYAVEGPDGPEYADFHSLRHSYLTLGGRSGIDLRTLQELAGHSKPELTARYSNRRIYDLAGAVDKLPNLVPSKPDTNVAEVPLRLTGTDGAVRLKADKSIRLGVVTGDIERHHSAPKYTTGRFRADAGDSPQTLEMQGAGTSQHRPASNCISEDDGTRTRNHRIDRHAPNDSFNLQKTLQGGSLFARTCFCKA